MTTATTAAGPYLSFWIGGQPVAVRAAHVKEIVHDRAVTCVPATSRSVRGVVNLRGMVVPVFDLSPALGLPPIAVSPRRSIVYLELPIDGEQALLGVTAEAMGRLVELRPEDIEEPPAFGTRIPPGQLLGVTRVEGEFVLLLDIERLLASRELMGRPGPAGAPDRESRVA